MGQRLADHAVLDVSLVTSCASSVTERLQRRIEQLPNRSVELRSASKYDTMPALFALNSTSDGIGQQATIRVTLKSPNRLEISFAPLLWDVFSVLRILQLSVDTGSPGAGIVQSPPLALLQQEAIHTPSQVAHALADGLGLASPKARKTGTGSHHQFESAPHGGAADIAERLLNIMAERCLHSSTLVRELPIGVDTGAAVGNLSYYTASAPDWRTVTPCSLADQLALHAPLAGQPDKVATAVGLTVLPHIPGIDRIAIRGAVHGLAVHLVAFPSETQLHVSATYSAANFNQRESAAHFRDVMTVFRNGNPTGEAGEGAGTDTTIAMMLTSALKTDVQGTAVATADRRYSRAELLRSACAIAKEIPSGTQLIGICCANSFEFVAAVVACILRGVCYVPLDSKAGIIKLKDIVSSSSLQAVLCTADFEALVDSIGTTPLLISSDITRSCDVIVHAGDRVPIYRIHTSGTTGMPKPVDVTSENLCALFRSYNDISSEIYRCTWGFTSSIGFDASVKQYLGPLLFGGIVFVPARSLTEDPVAVLRELKNNRVGVLNLTPQLLRIAVEAGLCDFDYVLVSGDVLPPRLVDDFFECSKPSNRLINLYGPTETTINAMYYEVSRELRYRSVPIGRALGGSAVEVQDHDGCKQPYCAVGSLEIIGDIVTGGHHGVEGDRFDWNDGRPSFDTGDQCFVWYDDLVYFVGRRDNQVKINGVRVNLNEMTQRLRTYLDVTTCYVALRGSRLFVVLRRDELEEGDSRLLELRDGSRFGRITLTPIVVDEIPINVNGKVDLDVLLASDEQAAASGDGPMEDMLDLEVLTMLRAVAEGRDFEALGMDDNLFDHGFDSLLTMEFTFELNNRYGLELSPAQLVAHPTARQLAVLLRSENRRSSRVQALGLAERERLFVLLPPVLGNGLIFLPLTMRLAADHRVAVCSYPGETHEAEHDLAHIASGIADELRRQGLLHHQIEIVGYSMGGSVGYELCKLLAKESRVVGLTILDKPVLPRHNLSDQKQAGEKLIDKLLQGREPSETLRLKMVTDLHRNVEATFRYEPCDSISVPSRLFICTQEDRPVQPDEWAPYLRGALTVVKLPCRHEDVLDKPHVDAVLAALAHPAFEPREAALAQ